jgi:CheY-like chemotaxis protein
VAHTLLLADDSVTIQRVIELTFADEDVQVIAVGDGDAAIAAIDRTPPDIVLADVGMPGRSGYDVAQHVKRTPRLAHIPVVLLTGAFEPIDQERASAAGCDAVLAKPFEPQLVIGRVKELLARARSAGPATPTPSPEVDRYFDELDQAFATLHTAPAPPDSGVRPIDPSPSVEWFASEPDTAAPASGEARSMPVTFGSPQHAFDVPDVPPARPAFVPPLAEAFAALLAAERTSAQDQGAAPIPPEWPVRPGAVSISEEAMAGIVRQVLDRMSDAVVRETTAEIVSTVAERLVREEIDRIKSHIR